MTSEGSVASNAGKLAKPALPAQSDCALICSAWSNNCTFLKTMPCSCMHAHNQQYVMHQRLPHPNTRAGGAGSHSYRAGGALGGLGQPVRTLP
eukprot:1150971-Pelagomonas_calceolata.AAC.4